MQYAVFLTMIASALAAKSFGVITIHSGSIYQNSGLTVSGDSVGVGSGTFLDLVLNDDGSLADKESKKYLNVKENSEVSLTSTSQKGFAIKNSALTFDGTEPFVVCSAKLAEGNACSDSVGVRLRVVSEKDADNYYPSSDSTSTAPHSTTLVTKTATAAAATTTTAAAAASLATDGTITPGKKFGLIAIHSGSEVQNSGVMQVSEHPHVFSVGGSQGSDLTISFEDDKTSLVDSNGRGVNVDSSTGEVGSVAPFGRAPATTGFSISSEGHLTFDHSEDFYACPSGNGFSLSDKSCEGGISIALRVVYA